ncbi:MAG: DnaA regulatory inactivator Hda, partial [Pseudomonas sp.]
MTQSPPRQLPLQIRLDDSATFENYHVAPATRELAEYLQPVTELQQFSFLWGACGTGKTHLLQALCHAAEAEGLSAFYISLQQHQDYSPLLFEQLETFDIVCLDDVEAIAAHADWEVGLFSLFNRMRDSNARLVVTSVVGPRELPIALPDLLSRLQSGVVFQVPTLDDADKIKALQLRAHRRGFEVADEVASYVLQRNARSLHSLFDLL